MTRFLICLDLDGTLLTKDKRIRRKSKHYIKKLINEGHIVTFSSGRPFRSLQRYYEELNLQVPVICFNGAYVFNPHDASFPSICKRIPYQDIVNLYNNFYGSMLDSAYCEAMNNIYLDVKDPFLFFLYNPGHTKLVVSSINKTLQEDPFTCVFHFKEYTDDIKEKMTKYCLENFKNTRMRFWFHNEYTECYTENVNKATGIKHVADFYNIDYDHIIVFGDAENDIDMLESFKNSFAMKNALDLVKKSAHFITKKDNNHNGVIFELKRFLKKNN